MKYEYGAIIAVKIKENLYTLAQARENNLFEFFDEKMDTEDAWRGIDLTSSKSLFCMYVASSKMRGVFLKLKAKNSISPSKNPTIKTMLSADPVVGRKYASIVNLVDLPSDFDSVGEKLVKHDLQPSTNNIDLCRYELTGMVGSKYIINRLIKYYDEGVNWDVQKDFIFKGDLKPLKGINF